ncbi:MAG: YggS family pyridoxal phosphate-dependent enzyme [Vicinamibacterales bacterium]
MLTRADIAERLAEVRARIDRAATRSGRPVDDVRLIAVSKTFPAEAVHAAFAAGQAEFGENKVQEGLQKIARSADMKIRWHLIGHLQSNKARKAAASFDWIHTVDSLDLLDRIEAAAAEAQRTPAILVQVDLAKEATKHGAPVTEVPAIVTHALGCKAARLAGLMVLPPLADNPEQARPWFRELRALRDRLIASGVPAERLSQLSMGMSHDFEVAIEEGATIVRVGSAIFGERDTS